MLKNLEKKIIENQLGEGSAMEKGASAQISEMEKGASAQISEMEKGASAQISEMADLNKHLHKKQSIDIYFSNLGLITLSKLESFLSENPDIRGDELREVTEKIQELDIVFRWEILKVNKREYFRVKRKFGKDPVIKTMYPKGVYPALLCSKGVYYQIIKNRDEYPEDLIKKCEEKLKSFRVGFKEETFPNFFLRNLVLMGKVYWIRGISNDSVDYYYSLIKKIFRALPEEISVNDILSLKEEVIKQKQELEDILVILDVTVRKIIPN